MSEETEHPPIPGLGEDPQWKYVPSAESEALARTGQAPGLTFPQTAPEAAPEAGVWVDKFEMLAPPGQQGRLAAGSVGGIGSQLWMGTMPTGRIRFQVLEQAAPIPPPLPTLVGFEVTPSIAKPGAPLMMTATLSAPALSAGMVVQVMTPFGAADITVPASLTVGRRTINVPIGQPAGVIVLTARLNANVLPYQVTILEDTPLPVPELVRFTGPATAKPGQTISFEAALSAPAPSITEVVVSRNGHSRFSIYITAGKLSGSMETTIAEAQAEGTVVFTAVLGDKTLAHPVSILKDTPVPPIPTPGPIPPVLRTIDCTGKTQQQIQAAINTAQPGDGILLGAGVYSLSAAMGGDGETLSIVNKEGVTLFGVGPATILDCQGREGIWCRTGGRLGMGAVIRDLQVRNARRAICALDPQRLWVQRVTMTNVSHGYASERTTAFDNMMAEWPVVLTDCIVRGWSAHGAMLHGGETVERCQLIDTPGNSGSTYSHGLYIQGAKNLTLRDILIENTSGHSGQIYSDSASHAANGALDILMERITCRNCFMGFVIAANGDYDRITIIDMTHIGTVSRNAANMVISATNSPIQNLRMKNLVFDGGGDAMALQSGQTGVIRGMVIEGMVVKNHQVGIRIGSSATGWPYTRIEESSITGCQMPGVPLPVVGSSSGLVVT